jgi:hypothetical protein
MAFCAIALLRGVIWSLPPNGCTRRSTELVDRVFGLVMSDLVKKYGNLDSVQLQALTHFISILLTVSVQKC